MEKKVVILICFLIGFAIFLLLWIFYILSPLIRWAETMQRLGIPYDGPIADFLGELLGYIFLNVYFIGMIVCGVMVLIFRIIARKALKSMKS